MPGLPTGTVTFLFTDVEGSTKLLTAHPNTYRAAVRRHHDLLLEAVESNEGFVFETVGDAVYAAFAAPTDAVKAALCAQIALRDEDWGETPVHVRMGIHLGEVEAHPVGGAAQGARYFGAPLVRCARLMSAAHGGQVVLSDATAVLVRDTLEEGAALRDLGEHRLKDLARPERIHQLVHADLSHEFPALRSLDARPNNLPVQLTPLVGRDREVREVRQLLERADVRLVSLVGPGGAGKTRLALHVAAEAIDDYGDGVFAVELDSIRDATLVVSAIARTLGVREAEGRPAANAVREYLRDKCLLLVLDNFEQLLASPLRDKTDPDAAVLVGQLLGACPRLKVLATSRVPLRVRGEHEIPVPPLTHDEAMRLFVERARAVRPDFVVTDDTAAAVAEVCQRLDGLPLALELAAARVRLLSPRQMLARLEQRLPLLTGGARDLPARQQTLRGAITWSHELLESGDQTIFRRLAVFAGGFTLEAAEETLPETSGGVLEGLEPLVAHSLVQRQDEARFGLLETIREYALERLEAANEGEEMRRRHAAYFAALAEQGEAELHGPRQVRWLERLEREHVNFRAALHWAVAAREDEEALDVGLRLSGALGWFWYHRGLFGEGRAWLTQLVETPTDEERVKQRTATRSKALFAAGMLTYWQGDREAARRLFEESYAIGEERGDRRCVALALLGLGQVRQREGDADGARGLLERSLRHYREVGDDWGSAYALFLVGLVASRGRDHSAAAPAYGESLSIARRMGDRFGVARALGALGLIAYLEGDLSAARARYEEGLAIDQELGDRRGVAWRLHGLGRVAQAEGDAAAARAYHDESLAILRELGERARDAATAGVPLAPSEAERRVSRSS